MPPDLKVRFVENLYRGMNALVEILDKPDF